ncbi:MAG: transcription termination factor NusA [Dehalococcoidia bacterium]
MKSEFMLAITQLAAEKKLPLEVVLEVVEAALVSAFKKDSFTPNQEVSVKLNPNTGKVTVFAEMTVVETVADPVCEISLDDARKIKEDIQIDDTIEVESTPQNAGRIAAQTAKQVVLQRLHEAERELVFEEFSNREGQIITGIIQRVEPRQIVVDLGRTEGILTTSEQVRSERYRVGQRLKVCLVEVHRSTRGPQIFISRTHPNLLRGLLEVEVPEIHSGVVELKSIAREAGNRSKIAVVARQQGVDAVGSCVGLRGIRIQNIVNELNGEKIDIVEWHSDLATFIANALSPAQVATVELDEEVKAATVVVPDRQLSLAIGREGQNARLAAKLTGWRIDIKSTTVAEEEKAALAELVLRPVEETLIEEREPEETLLIEPEEAITEAPEEYVETLVPKEEEIALPIEEVAPIEEFKPAIQIRFAEDVMPGRKVKPEKRARKGKARTVAKETVEGAAKPKKARRAPRVIVDEDEDEDPGRWEKGAYDFSEEAE